MGHYQQGPGNHLWLMAQEAHHMRHATHKKGGLERRTEHICRGAFTTTAVGLKTPKGCEVNVRARNAHETLCDLSHKVNVTTDGVDRVHKIDGDIL